MIPELKLKQLQYESDMWKRLLCFMINENIHLKNRLSEILKDKFNNKLLEEMENFQNNFIKEDNLISCLRSDLSELDRLLARDIFIDGKTVSEVDKKFKKLRDNINFTEEQFGKLKSNFNNYLSENL